MNPLTNVTKALGKKANKLVFTLKKHAPTIFTAVGVGCGIASVVTGVKAGVKIQKHISEKTPEPETKTDTEEKKKPKISSDTVRYAAKELALPVGLCVAGTACILGSHNAMSRRNSAITAAYIGLDQTFKSYKNKVVKELGEEKAKEVEFGKPSYKNEENPETGEITEVPVYDVNDIPRMDLSRRFSESYHYEHDTPIYNKQFLKATERHLNLLLQSKGYLFLNDAYKELGFKPTKAGTVLGWWDSDDKVTYVDLGIIDIDPGVFNNEEGAVPEEDILVTFNVDGDITEHFAMF